MGKRNLNELFSDTCTVQTRTNKRTRRTMRTKRKGLKRRAVTESIPGRVCRPRKHDYKRENVHLHSRVETLSKQVQALEEVLRTKEDAWKQERKDLHEKGQVLLEHIMVLREEALYTTVSAPPRSLSLVSAH